MTTIHAIVVRPDETAERFTFERGDIRVLQSKVGGYLEGASLPDGFAFWNEEGQLMGLQSNPAASALVGRYVVGPVVFTGPPQRAEATDVTPRLEALIQATGVTISD